MMRTTVALLASVIFVASATAQEKSEKFAEFVTGGDEAVPVTELLIKKLKDSKPFEPVAKEDPSKVVVLIECMPRKQTDPFVCMYVSHLNGAALKTMLGGGLYFSASADVVASNFLSAIAANIVERWDSTSKDNLKSALESCLFLTDSKCHVPDLLQKDLGTKQITLRQYLMKMSQ